MQRPHVTIRYCPLCGWLLRSAWLAQELLGTFGEELARVSLEPAESGVFCIDCDGVVLWDRKQDGGFPEAKVLKHRLRSELTPWRHAPYSDSKPMV